MLLVLVVASLLTLAGCGDTQDEPIPWDTPVSLVTPAGIQVYYPDTPAPTDLRAEWFDEPYQAVQVCLGLAARGPRVYVTPDLDRYNVHDIKIQPGAQLGGLYFFAPNVIMVRPTLSALAHEFVHYLLDMSGYPDDRNKAHDHPGFMTCV